MRGAVVDGQIPCDPEQNDYEEKRERDTSPGPRIVDPQPAIGAHGLRVSKSPLPISISKTVVREPFCVDPQSRAALCGLNIGATSPRRLQSRTDRRPQSKDTIRSKGPR